MVDLKTITKADIEQAVSGKYQQILESNRSTDYDLIHRGEKYSSKVVLVIAYLINQGMEVSDEEYGKLSKEFTSSEANMEVLKNFGFQIDKRSESVDDYDNFFNMLKFWIKQTDNNINSNNKVEFKEIKENNIKLAEKLFTNPQFFPEYLKHCDFSIRISFLEQAIIRATKSIRLCLNLTLRI